jgi:hypothetical protein
MIKLIISFNALLFSIIAFLGSKETIKPNIMSNMPMCSTMQEDGINPWTGNVLFSKFQSIETPPSPK